MFCCLGSARLSDEHALQPPPKRSIFEIQRMGWARYTIKFGLLCVLLLTVCETNANPFGTLNYFLAETILSNILRCETMCNRHTDCVAIGYNVMTKMCVLLRFDAVVQMEVPKEWLVRPIMKLTDTSCGSGELNLPGKEATATCMEINECLFNPCQHGGVCLDEINGFLCDCTGIGYNGTTCEIEINECLSNPCQHGGVCVDEINGFLCDCTGIGYNGTTCEIEVNECLSSPCQYGGICTNEINDHSCDCVGVGYIGTTCEIDSNVVLIAVNGSGRNVREDWLNEGYVCPLAGTHDCSEVYKNGTLYDNWYQFSKALVRLIVARDVVAWLLFYITGTDPTTWWNGAKLINSSWTDLPTPDIVYQAFELEHSGCKQHRNGRAF